jgi:hypothetical protein
LNTNPDANVSTQEAQAGVGKKGRGLDDVKGSGRIVSQPASTLFSFKEKAVFDIQIPQAMNLYRATHGNFPKSHKDFQTHIIKANNLRLPELESNQRYVYDPETQKLMVETQH